MRRRGPVADSSRDRPDGSRMSPQGAEKSSQTRLVACKACWMVGGDRNCHLHALDRTASPSTAVPLAPPDNGSWVNAGPRAEQATHRLLDGQARGCCTCCTCMRGGSTARSKPLSDLLPTLLPPATLRASPPARLPARLPADVRDLEGLEMIASSFGPRTPAR